MTQATTLLAALDLAPAGRDAFTGTSLSLGPRIFGGQVVAQALAAAGRTVDAGRPAHSLHAVFLLPGDPGVPLRFEVTRLRDGGSFSARSVAVVQSGRTILTLTASFQREEGGLDHQVAMPDVPPPEALPDEAAFAAMVEARGSEAVRRYWARPRPLVLRPVDPERWFGRPGAATSQAIWVRTAAPLPKDPAVHRLVLAYLSDMTLLDTALAVHGRSVFDRDMQVASLDHAMWFHRAGAADDWVLYAQDCPSTSGGRGFARGRLYARTGVLLASVAQEGLMRMRPKP